VDQREIRYIYSVDVKRIPKTRSRSGTRAVAAYAVVLALLAGAVLPVGVLASGGVSCTAGAASIEMSWTGEFRAYEYTARLTDSSGSESSQTVDWSTGTTETASVTFTGLAAGAYTGSVTMQTVDGSWISIGETSCTVSAGETTTTTTTTATTLPQSPSVTSASPDDELAGYSATTTAPDIQLAGHSSNTPLSPRDQVGGL